MATKDTKDKIVATAVRLFNEHGTRAVSTNHIAEAMGVSPGKLYYHFRNKEEIIREIYRDIVRFFNRTRKIPRNRTVGVADLQELMSATFYYMWEYRFFVREQIPLMQRDPLLKARVREVRRRRLIQIEHFYRGLILSGVMRQPKDAATLANLSTLTWIIVNTWLNFITVDGEPISPESVQRGVDLMLQVLQPYLTEDAMETLARLRAERSAGAADGAPAAMEQNGRWLPERWAHSGATAASSAAAAPDRPGRRPASRRRKGFRDRIADPARGNMTARRQQSR